MYQFYNLTKDFLFLVEAFEQAEALYPSDTLELVDDISWDELVNFLEIPIKCTK